VEQIAKLAAGKAKGEGRIESSDETKQGELQASYSLGVSAVHTAKFT